jgi:Zn-dependent metalloprotease
MGQTATIAIMIAASGTMMAQPLRVAEPERAAIEAWDAGGAKPARSAASGPKLLRSKNGVLTAGTGLSTRPYAGTPLQAASSFLAENRAYFGGLPIEQLRPVQARRVGSRTYARLEQHLDGIPVRGAQVVVHLSAANSVEAFKTSALPNISVRGEWRIDETAAIDAALAAHGSPASAQPSAERIYLVRNGAAHPVWRVVFRSGDPAGDWEYLISADSGAVQSRQDLRAGAHAFGFAYPRNPVRGGREQVLLPNLLSDRFLTSAQNRVFTYLPALRSEVEPGTVIQKATREADSFLYDADDARASEVQLYYGMESASERFRALGFAGFPEPLPGVVLFQDWDAAKRRFTGANNAFFSPVAFGPDKGGIFFYLTSKNGDTSLDTDVIYHEYAHAVVSDLVGPRQSAVFKALNEGTADYFSNTFLDDSVMAEYAARLFNLRTPFLRRSDNRNSWPYNTVGESHADGNIWSGALWDVRERLGSWTTDRIAINTVAMLSPDSEFYDAAEAAIIAAGDLFGASAAQTVAQVMEQRGIYTRAAEVASEAQWISRGEKAENSIPAADPGYLLVGAEQHRIEVPEGATRLTVRVRATSDVRFYLRYRVPVMVQDGTIRAEQRSDTSMAPSGSLSIDNTPELQAGMYYIAVVNTMTQPVKYEIEAETEGGGASSGPVRTTLEEGRSAAGSVPSGPFLASRQFAIEVPEGVRAVVVNLSGSQDVDLYVRIGGPVFVNGTGCPQGDLVSDSAEPYEEMTIIGATAVLRRRARISSACITTAR